ncbi:hypothetical protein [Kamptonema formosum]|uniref:hypothetical protein n=1 Tax=Kamptonema formosum TaxID=331992 RepID=UPI000348EDB2|nr:hypothetical protein [Oscillatoria sp. PCC 10802]
MTDELTQRITWAAESLLDNETLTPELEDAAGGAALTWATDLSRRVALATAGLDDEAAEAFMAPKLAAIGELIRLVSRWAASYREMDAGGRESFLSQVIEAALKIYPDYQPPHKEQQQAFLREPFPADPRDWIVNLRRLVEGDRNAQMP